MSYWNVSHRGLDAAHTVLRDGTTTYPETQHGLDGSTGLVYRLTHDLAIKVGRTLEQHNAMLNLVSANYTFLAYLYKNHPSLQLWLPKFYGIINTPNNGSVLAMENYGDCNNLDSNDYVVSKLRQSFGSYGFHTNSLLFLEKCLFKNTDGEIKFGDLDAIGAGLPNNIKSFGDNKPPTIKSHQRIFDSLIPIS